MAMAKHRVNIDTAISDAERQRTRLWLKLLKSTRSIENELRRRLVQNFDTTLPRFDVMAALYRSDSGLNMSALSQALMVSNGNVTGIVERLVSEGLLMRLQGEQDRRVSYIRLTKKGKTIFEEMAQAHRLWVAEILGPIDEFESESIMASLEKIKRADENESEGLSNDREI